MAINSDRRLIEDYLPLNQVNNASRREKKPRKGHVSTLHLWWARQPLAACRAAVFATFVRAPSNGQGRAGFGRTITDLCQWGVTRPTVDAARMRLLEANGGEPPKVLDMFAGGGAIPLEASRLGCETHAVELNPVAHLIELCTLVYPQKHGPQLAKAVRQWGAWVRERVAQEAGDLYPPVPLAKDSDESHQVHFKVKGAGTAEKGTMTPVAYLWTRTVVCPNPKCRGTVPLVRQTWLSKTAGRLAALTTEPDTRNRCVRFRLVTSKTEKGLGIEPADRSKRGETTCLLCGASVKGDHIKTEGKEGRMGKQLMAVVCTRADSSGKFYAEAEDVLQHLPSEESLEKRLSKLCEDTGLSIPNEPILDVAKQALFVVLYGFRKWSDLFTPRQRLVLLTFVKWTREAHREMLQLGMNPELARAVTTYLAFGVDKVANRGSNMCRWNANGGKIESPLARGALPMMWDFPESNPLGDASGNWADAIENTAACIEAVSWPGSSPAIAVRCDARELPYPATTFDAVITDPPYYDNVPYSNLSDFFYVWLKRTVGFLYPEHFRTDLTPKRAEAVKEATLHGGDDGAAEKDYEEKMSHAFKEAHRVLKRGAPLVVVYAHKTTKGWSTLVDALRNSGFMVSEAWPISTQAPGREREQESAALGSSIYIVARKREEASVGDYVNGVRPALAQIVNERVKTLINEVSGADLHIAAIGAGMRAFTQYGRVELSSGQEVEAETFLDDVEQEVGDTILEMVTGETRKGLGRVDKPTKFYIHYRLRYGAQNVDFNEANIMAHGVGVELDGPASVTAGPTPLAKKIKVKGSGNLIALQDYLVRGSDDRLGFPKDAGPAPLVDVLHRLLWLVENSPRHVQEFLQRAGPDLTALRLVAQALAGKVLTGEGEDSPARTKEQQAVGNLMAAWKRLVEERQVFRFRAGDEIKIRQKRLDVVEP